MNPLLQDIRYAARMLRKNPGFTAVAVLTLALGIGTTTAVFSIVHGVLLRPIPHVDSDRLVRISTVMKIPGRSGIPGSTYLVWEKEAQTLTGLAPYQPWSESVLLPSGGPVEEEIRGANVGQALFDLLDVQPVQGRMFLPDEEKKRIRVVIVSHRFWRGRLGSDPEFLGKPITIWEIPHQIIGILPPGFQFPLDTDLWTPMPAPGEEDLFGPPYLLGRIRPGTAVEQVRAELDQLVVADDRRGGLFAVTDVLVTPLLETIVGNVRPLLTMLSGAVVFVLMIACVNVANLLLSRAIARSDETAIRATLGAGRLRLAQQLLTESMVLSIAGGLAGILVAYVCIRMFAAFGPATIPRLSETRLDLASLGYIATLILFVGILSGLAPLVQAAKPDWARAMRLGKGQFNPGRQSSSGNWLTGALAVAQMTFALVLLISAGLLMNSFLSLIQLDPGFEPRNLLGVTLKVPGTGLVRGPLEALGDVGPYGELLEQLRGLDGVEQVAVADTLPPYPPDQMTLRIEERKGATKDSNLWVHKIRVSPRYFQTMGMRLVEGRSFHEDDARDSARVVVVNEALARMFFPNGSAVGIRIRGLGGPGQDPEIVGVVGNVRQWGLTSELAPILYIPDVRGEAIRMGAVRYLVNMHLLIRVRTDQAGLIAVIRERIESLGVKVLRLEAVDNALQRTVAHPRFYSLLFGVFSGAALLLSAVGVYGVLSFLVSRRTHEFGVRMALGAQRNNILRMVLRQGMTLVVVGAASGMIVSYWLTKYLKTFLYEVEPTDPLTFAAVTVLLSAVALAACWVPARRATRVDPMTALRYE